MNYSKIYGMYGGTSNENHYIPPNSPTFIPNLPKPDMQDRILLEQLVQKLQFYVDNAPNILIRTNTSSLPGNIDTFVMTTSGKPEDQIVYTSNKDVITIDSNTFDSVVDGGYF